jgi:DHA1 family tetracycline resistance protein-like MFS transporter
VTSRSLLAPLCVIVAVNTFSIGGFAPLLPEMSSGAGLADWELGILAGVFGFARMIADLPAGLFIQRHLRYALLLAPLGIVAGVLCLGAGGPFWVLVLGRGVMAVGHTLGMLGGLTAVLRYSAPHRLGASLNVYEFSAMIGMLGGVMLVGSLPAALPWNIALIVTCSPQIIGVLALPRALQALARAGDAAGTSDPDVALPSPRPGSAPGPSSLVVLAFAAGTAIALTYTTVEQFLLPLRASREFGLGRSGVASLLMTSQLADLLTLLPVGLLADRRGVSRMLGLVLFAFAAGALLIGFGTLPLMAVGCASLGLGMAGWMLPLGVIRSVTSAERIGWLTALYRVSVDAGMFLGPFVSGVLGLARAGIVPVILAAGMTAIAVLLLRHTDAIPRPGHRVRAP